MVIYLPHKLLYGIKRLFRLIWRTRPCTRQGFPSRYLAKAGRELLPHDFTLTSPKACAFRRAVYFLLHFLSLKNFFFKAWLLAIALFSKINLEGVRTFLPPQLYRCWRATTQHITSLL